MPGSFESFSEKVRVNDSLEARESGSSLSSVLWC